MIIYNFLLWEEIQMCSWFTEDKKENKYSKEKANLFEKMYQNNILPKSLRLKPLIKSTKVYNIMQHCKAKPAILNLTNKEIRKNYES